MTTIEEASAVSTAQVRAWAEHRELIDPGGRGRLPAEIWSLYATEHAGTPAPAADLPGAGQPLLPLNVPARELPPAQDGQAREETPPREIPRERASERASERARRFWQRDPKTDGDDRQRGGRRARRRVSLETLGGLAWAGAARLAAFAGETYLPVVKMMSFQGPVAGAVAEDLAKGTIIDRIAQPVARLAESGGAAGALLGAPALTALVCRRPALYPQVRPMLMQCMKEWVIVAGPKIREMRKREEKFAEEMASFSEEFGVSVDELLDEVFHGLIPDPPEPGVT